MFLSKLFQSNARSFRALSNAFRDARSFCTTASAEKETAGKAIQTENKATETVKKEAASSVGVTEKEAPKEEKIIECDYAFVTKHPYGESNKKEKWITFYFLTGDGEKYKLMGYIGWEMLRAIRMNRLLHLFETFHYCDNGRNNCANCHVRLDRDFYKTMPAIDEVEYYYVRYQHEYFPGSSRLACRIVLQKSHDGAVIRLPKRLDKIYEEQDEFEMFDNLK